ncbi:type 1 hydrophobin [Crassisporium funariophilum]|nr:type 1 hydrophobin [Crassisporium funariophilum]
MFSKLAILVATMAVFVAAAPSPQVTDSCNTGPVQCCNQMLEAEDEHYDIITALLSLDVASITGQIGLSCTPITAIGVGSGANCNSSPVCCSDNQFNGLVAVGCTPVNIGL